MSARGTHVFACGALGRYDRERVLAIAAALDAELEIVHEDSRSILALDRPPIRWRGERVWGLAWSERPEPVTERLGSWEDAATIGAACGLACDGRRRFVHSSVAGIAPIYFLASDGAVYFATRIDPLVTTTPGHLSVDWDTWASILAFDHPLGDRTPFAEIRRLPPCSRLESRRGRARVSEERWAWAEVEPRLTVVEGVDAVLEQMRMALGRLPAGGLICPLSGGWDSRLILLLFTEKRLDDVLTLTYTGHGDLDGRLAPPVATAAGVPHEVLGADHRHFWRDAERRFERTDYQQPFTPWTVTLSDRLRELPGTVADGFGLDNLAQPGQRMITAEAVAAGGSREASRELWRRFKVLPKQGGAGAFARPFARAITAITRRQLLADTERFAGHPGRPSLSLYWTRAVRGISLRPGSLWGSELWVSTPFTDHGVVSALLAIRPEAAWDSKVYEALFARFDPAIAALPSTHDDAPRAERPPEVSASVRRWAPAIARGYHERLADGPLTPFLSAGNRRLLARAQAGGRVSTPVGARGPTLFHLWCERYRDRLGEIDPGAAFGVAPRSLKRE